MQIDIRFLWGSLRPSLKRISLFIFFRHGRNLHLIQIELIWAHKKYKLKLKSLKLLAQLEIKGKWWAPTVENSCNERHNNNENSCPSRVCCINKSTLICVGVNKGSTNSDAVVIKQSCSSRNASLINIWIVLDQAKSWFCGGIFNTWQKISQNK